MTEGDVWWMPVWAVRDPDMRVILRQAFPNLLAHKDTHYQIRLYQQVGMTDARHFTLHVKPDGVTSPILTGPALEVWALLEWPEHFRRQ
jgi:hypothetical protein